MWGMLQDWYTGLSAKVAVAGETSADGYPVDTGLMEGAILSPFLYTRDINHRARSQIGNRQMEFSRHMF